MKKRSVLINVLGILLTALIVALCLFLRYLAKEQPSWTVTRLVYPLLLLRFFADGEWLMDIHLVLAVYIVSILAPCIGRWDKWHRYLIRPLSGIIAFLLLCTPSWGMINKISDQVFQATHAEKYQQMRERIAEAEYALVSSGGGHASQTLSEYLPELTFKGTGTYDDGLPVYYGRSAILVDFDAPSMTFCDYGGGNDQTYQLLTVEMKPTDAPPTEYDYFRVRFFDGHECELVYYFTGDRNLYGGDYTIVCITMRMPNGSLWYTTDLIDPTTGKNYDIRLYPADDDETVRDFSTWIPK